jgi:antitoxin component of MazEF toxin-antitoxin module
VKEQLSLNENSAVDVSATAGGLHLAPSERRIPKYNLDDLLAEYEQWPQEMKDYREWVDAPRVGRELI